MTSRDPHVTPKVL